jgi:hypothetical protein
MNLEYLGDALDHWKGSLFEYLQAERVVRDFVVDPMATDADKWTEDDFGLYACLLRIKLEQIIRHKAFVTDRSSYFAEIGQNGDLFLDPDTGIATDGASPIAKYVKPRDVVALLQSPSDRLVAIYQHVRAQKTSKRVDGCLGAIATIAACVSWCSYESPTVAMIFLCRDGRRTRKLAKALKKLLGRHTERRVRWSKDKGAELLT